MTGSEVGANDPVWAARATLAAYVLSGSAVCLGLLTVIGWQLDILALESVPVPAWIRTNPMSAIGFIMLGTAVWLLIPVSAGRVRILIGRLLACAVLLVAVTRLIDYTYSVDRLLFTEQLGDNRMELHVAYGFLFLGAALLLLEVRALGGYWFSTALVLLVGMVSVLSLCGHFYSDGILNSQLTGWVFSSLNAAVILASLSAAILFARTQREPLASTVSASAGGMLARRLLPAAFLVPLCMGWIGLEGLSGYSYYGFDTWMFAEHVTVAVGGTMLMFSLLIWWSANRLYHVDVERARARAELESAKEAAEAASAAKSRFLATMSHEIRTPMKGIMAMAELLEDTELQVTQREYLGAINESAANLLHMLNDTLDFSKIEAGKLELDYEDFSLRELLADVMQVFVARASAKGIELAYFIPHDIPDCVTGDSGRLRQVLTNLMGNAVKFTAQGEVTLDVRASRNTGSDVMLRFAVRDTGPGIAPEHHSRLFKAFTQVDDSLSRRFGGTGLGLAIASQLVDMMGGKINLVSDVNKGSVFFFKLPFGVAQAENSKLAFVVDLLRGVRVLVVDDSATWRRHLQGDLGGYGMACDAVGSGAEALEALKTAKAAGIPYQILIMDMIMPQMDGVAVARAVYDDYSCGTPVVIMLTTVGCDTPDKRDRHLERVECLPKPVRQDDLLISVAVSMGLVEPKVRGQRASWFTNKPGNALPSLKILVAEDNEINQRVIRRLLERLEQTPDLVDSGEAVLSAIQKKQYDVVLMDIEMPVMDGLQATKAIRSSEQGSAIHLPIVAMTAHAMKGDREHFMSAGIDDYVSKPLRLRDLRTALQRVTAGD